MIGHLMHVTGEHCYKINIKILLLAIVVIFNTSGCTKDSDKVVSREDFGSWRTEFFDDNHWIVRCYEAETRIAQANWLSIRLAEKMWLFNAKAKPSISIVDLHPERLKTIQEKCTSQDKGINVRIQIDGKFWSTAGEMKTHKNGVIYEFGNLFFGLSTQELLEILGINYPEGTEIDFIVTAEDCVDAPFFKYTYVLDGSDKALSPLLQHLSD